MPTVHSGGISVRERELGAPLMNRPASGGTMTLPKQIDMRKEHLAAKKLQESGVIQIHPTDLAC